MGINHCYLSLSHYQLAFLLEVIHQTVRTTSDLGITELLADIGRIIPLSRITAVTARLNDADEVEAIVKLIAHTSKNVSHSEYATFELLEEEQALKQLLSSHQRESVDRIVLAPDANSLIEWPAKLGLDRVVLTRSIHRLSLRTALIYYGEGLSNGHSSIPIFDYITPHLHSALLRTTLQPGAKHRLSKREKEVLRWVAIGKTSWETARILSISERTVIFHIQNAMQKLGTSRRSQAVAQAVAHGLIDIEPRQADHSCRSKRMRKL